jgi:chromate transporter
MDNSAHTMNQNLTSADAGTASPPTVGEIFGGFLGLGLISFGGALPLARRAIVERRRWLSASDFTDLLGLCQFLPGGNIMNLSVAIGLHFRGIPGAVAAITGLIAAPTAIVLALGVIYARYSHDPHVMHMFAGLAAAAAGLLISMALKIASGLRGRPFGIAVAIVIFVAIAGFRLPLVPIMLIAAPASILLMMKVRA